MVSRPAGGAFPTITGAAGSARKLVTAITLEYQLDTRNSAHLLLIDSENRFIVSHGNACFTHMMFNRIQVLIVASI